MSIPDSTTSLPKLFAKPPKQYSPVPIWWWSGDRLERNRLRWQLERFAEGGIYNLVIMNLAPTSPLYGCDPDDPEFFSPEWWKLFVGVCEDAQELGVYLWIYDQIGFSGANLQGQLVKRKPGYAGQSIESISVVTDGPANLQCPAGGTAIAAFSVPVDTEGQPVGAPIQLQLQGDELHWGGQTPHRLRIVYAVRRGFDYCNPQACADLIDMVHGEFARRVGKYLGSVIVGSFQDELPSLPTWSGNFAQEFQKRCGYDIVPCLAALWEDYGTAAEKVRADYQQVRAALAEEAFFQPLHAWHEQYGMLCGFDQQGPARGGHPVETVKFYADYLRTHRWFSAPGSDHHGEAKIHSSLAHLYNRPRVWIEAFHSSGWGGTLEETFDWLLPWFRAGANLYDPHAVYYSTKGAWWEWAAPSTCWRQPYWRHYPLFSQAVARLCAVLSTGDHVCDVGLLFPTATIQTHLRLDGAGAAAKRAHDTYLALAGRMVWFDAHPGVLDRDRRDFDVLDEDSVQRGSAEQATGDQPAAFHIGKEAYQAIILPACTTLAAETAVKLRQFVSTGGLLIAVGTAPQQAAGNNGDDTLVHALGALFGCVPNAVLVPDVEDVPAVLARLPRRVDAPVPTLLRKAEGRDILFVPAAHPGATQTNSMRAPNLRYSFDSKRYAAEMPVAVHGVTGTPWLWDPFTGQRRQLAFTRQGDGVVVTVPFDQGPVALIVWEKDDAATNLPLLPELGAPIRTVDISGSWNVTYIPTMDNRWGDFAKPNNVGSPPMQRWEFQHRVEQPGIDGLQAGWQAPDLDTTDWQRVQATFGQYGWSIGPLPVADLPPAHTVQEFRPDSGQWQPIVYSLSRGIYKDTLHSGNLGPKGHVPEEFLDFGAVKTGEGVQFRTTIYAQHERRLHLALGAPAMKQLWVNGIYVGDNNSGYLWQTPVTLQADANTLEFRLVATEDLPLRAYYAFVHNPVAFSRPEWLHPADTPHKDSIVKYAQTINLPFVPAAGRLQVASDAPCRITINGHEVGRQGDFDPYYRSARVQPYDIGVCLRQGDNLVEIEASDLDKPVSVLVDGVVHGEHGETGAIVSDAGWQAYRNGMAIGVMLRKKPWRDPAWCDLWRRPHPLPASDWLEDRPSDDTVVQLPTDAFGGGTRVEWLRFLLPPGAISMTAPLAGQARVFVDGVEIACESAQVTLPNPNQPIRTCAIRVIPNTGRTGGGLLDGPVTFTLGTAGRMLLGDWAAQGITAYSGGVSYSQAITVPDAAANGAPGLRIVLDLGRVRGTAEVKVNGNLVGARVLSPYRFDITDALHTGENQIEVAVFNTLGAYMDAASPTRYVVPGQADAGLYGPVTLSWVETRR